MKAFSHAGVGVDERAGADERARVQDRVAAGLHIVAKNGPELGEAGIHFLVACPDFDGRAFAGGGVFGAVDGEIGEFCACAEVGTLSEDAVADVGEVRGMGAVEEEAVFGFAGVPEDGIGQEDDIFPNVRPVPDNRAFADVRRADNVRARFDDGSFGDVDGCVAQICARMDVAEDGLGIADEAGDVFFEGFERFPDIFYVEQAEGNRVGEGEKVGGGEHGGPVKTIFSGEVFVMKEMYCHK